MHLKAIAPKRKANEFDYIVQAVLDIDVLITFLFAVFIEIKDIADNSAAPDFLYEKLRLHGPSAYRRWIVADLKYLHVSLLLHGAVCF